MYQFVRLCPLQFSMTRLQIIFILRISWDELLLPYQSLVMLPKFNFQKVRSATHRHVVWTHVEDLYTQGYGFSSSHVWMWELDYKESWALKNWCFWTVVLEKTLENHLDGKEIQRVHPKGNQSWIFIGRTDAEAETLNNLATWCKELTHLKRPWCWERLRVRGKGDNREWDGWMASLTWWTWVWVNSGSWW